MLVTEIDSFTFENQVGFVVLIVLISFILIQISMTNILSHVSYPPNVS